MKSAKNRATSAPTITETDRTALAADPVRMRRSVPAGVLLILLGLWAALIPFIGPSVSFGTTPDSSWKWTAPRGWYEVLPGGVAVLAGLVLLFAAGWFARFVAGVLAAAAGAWLVVAAEVAPAIRLGSVGRATAATPAGRMAEMLAYFTGVGAAIIATACYVIGRSTRTNAVVLPAARRPAAAAMPGPAAPAAAAAPGMPRHATPTAPTGQQAAQAPATATMAPASAAPAAPARQAADGNQRADHQLEDHQLEAHQQNHMASAGARRQASSMAWREPHH